MGAGLNSLRSRGRGPCDRHSYKVMLHNVFNLDPASGIGWCRAALAEVRTTCLLCSNLPDCTVARENECDVDNLFYGLAVGILIIAGGYGVGSLWVDTVQDMSSEEPST